MSSRECLDPRIVKATLNECPAIHRGCVVGNNFPRTSSQVVCAIIEVSSDGAAVRLRIEVLLLPPGFVRSYPPGQQIPLTKKGAILTKKLGDLERS